MTHLKQIQQIPLFNQYAGTFPILNPIYKDKQYITSFEKLKTLISRQEYTFAANYLAEIVLSNLASNYNCWYVKRMCFEKGVLELETELTWSKEFLRENIKNFQGWEYRRFLVEQSKEVGDEFEYLDEVLESDEKNYHVWAYRVWLVQYSQQFEKEKERVMKWLSLDLMNNSAWSYRHFLVSSTLKQQKDFQQEIELVLYCINKNKKNEAAWNYLRGWFPSIKLQGFPSRKSVESTLVFEYSQFPQVLERCLALAKEEQVFAQPLITLVHIQSQSPETVEYAGSICELLSSKQQHRSTYWKWVKEHLESSSE